MPSPFEKLDLRGLGFWPRRDAPLTNPFRNYIAFFRNKFRSRVSFFVGCKQN